MCLTRGADPKYAHSARLYKAINHGNPRIRMHDSVAPSGSCHCRSYSCRASRAEYESANTKGAEAGVDLALSTVLSALPRQMGGVGWAESTPLAEWEWDLQMR